MNPDRRTVIVTGFAAAALGAVSSAGGDTTSGAVVRPEDFGAMGDGVTNDTGAFAAMSAFVSRQGGGEVVLRRTTYLVGSQLPPRGADDYAFIPDKIMEFVDCSRPLIIRGNGAVLRCAPRLRFGTFDPATGRAVRRPQPNYHRGELSSPYKWMIKVERCSGPVEITDLELDGSLARLNIGGPWGDTGHQLPGTGLGLYDNSGSETVRRVYSHHHPLDGVIIDGLDRARAKRSLLELVRCEHNARQGCSVVGGYGYDFVRCKFNHTGKARLYSAPGAGVDIEAEGGKKVRDLRFSGCEFSDNTGVGVVADQGDSEDVRFTACTFIGTTSWAVWPKKPDFRFARCTFVGAIVHAYGDADPSRACRFLGCRFLDDPKLSPTGQVYGGDNPSHPIADLPGNLNVLFERCEFDLTHDCVLPWTTNVVIFDDCTMSQLAAATSYPRGTFIGRNRITGKVDLYSAKIRGELIVNGNRVPSNA